MEVWDTIQRTHLVGNQRPMQKNLKKYLNRHPWCKFVGRAEHHQSKRARLGRAKPWEWKARWEAMPEPDRQVRSLTAEEREAAAGHSCRPAHLHRGFDCV